jgi:hypothetical protein
VELGKAVQIEIESTTFVPATVRSKDGRTLGVRVKKLMLTE